MISGNPNSYRIELAEAIRILCQAVILCDASDKTLKKATQTVHFLSEKLRSTPRRSRMVGPREYSNGDLRFDYDLPHLSPISGQANPISPPLAMALEKGMAVGHVNFSVSYEGLPGLVHEGYIAAAFDDIFGLTISIIEKPVMTGILKVFYHKPCPLQTEFRLESKVCKISGRRLVTKAMMYADDQLMAEAEALFVAIDVGTYKEFAEIRNQRNGE